MIALPTPGEIAAALIAREELPPEKGDIGPEGKAGLDGQFGPPGPQGPKGDPGRNGVNGAPGDVGPIGPQGPQGDRGLKGDKGDKGDEGERGIQGPTGPVGPAGRGRSLFPRPGGGSGGSQTAAEVPFTPAGTISATNVQAAIEEVAAEAGSGAVAYDTGFYTTFSTVVPTDSGAKLPWELVDGSALLDLTDPLIPLIIDAGLYAFHVNVVSADPVFDMTAQFFVGFDLGDDFYQDGQGSMVTAYNSPRVSAAITRYLEAGATVDVNVAHNAGVDHQFNLDAMIQRIA